MTDDWLRADGGLGAHADGTRPRIEPHPLFDGLRIVDPIEGSQFALLTPSSVDPTEGDSDTFYFPVDTAANICTSEIETPYLVDVWIRDLNGNLVAQSTNEEAVSVPPGEYNVELSNAQVKLYLAVSGSISVEPRDERMWLSISGSHTMTVGVRSLHEQPAATITTTDDPEDLMAAISAFGSALKTTSCERSFPTLRGHPPLLERGATLDIPETLQIPDTGIRIEVPPCPEWIYPIAPLAYYLGASVHPGDEPVLEADGKRFSLTADGGFEATVGRILKQVFLMDCVTRTEGYYTVDLHERSVVEEQVDLDFAALYDREVAEQVRTYLEIPFEDIEDAVPRWKLTADVIAAPEHAETLPFLAQDLAIVRCPDYDEIAQRSIHTDDTSMADFFGETRTQRGNSDRHAPPQAGTEDKPFEEHVFRPPSADSIEQTYVGEGIPLGASKMTIESFYRRLEYEPSNSARTRVIVVCNEDEMNEENAVSEIYGTREWLEFDISVRENLDRQEMKEVLQTDADLLHYIGHVDEEGIRCADGWLDANELSDVNVSAFLLNACKSFEQGQAIVENGSIGGIVTVTDLLNKTATKLGRTLAYLLSCGFSLLSAIKLLEKDSLVANHYLVVGDGNTTVVQSRSGTPHHIKIVERENEQFEVTFYGYPSRRYHLGTMMRPLGGNRETRYLNSGNVPPFNFSRKQIEDFLSVESIPVELTSGVYWSDEISISELGSGS